MKQTKIQQIMAAVKSFPGMTWTAVKLLSRLEFYNLKNTLVLEESIFQDLKEHLMAFRKKEVAG